MTAYSRGSLCKIRLFMESSEVQKFLEEAFQYRNRLYHMAISLMGSADEAEDAVQDAFIKASERREQFESRSSLYTWLVRILINHCHDLRRKRQRRKTTSLERKTNDEKEVTLDIEDKRQNISEKVELSEASLRLMDTMNKLDRIYREVVLLRYFEEMSYSDISSCLEISEGTVKSRLNRARQILHRELQTLRIGEEYLAP